MLTVIAIELFETIVPGQAGKTVDWINLLASEGLAHAELAIELAQRVARQDVIMDRVSVVLGMADSAALQKLANESAFHRMLRAAHQKTRFGYKYVRRDKSVVNDRQTSGNNDCQQQNNIFFEPA